MTQLFLFTLFGIKTSVFCPGLRIYNYKTTNNKKLKVNEAVLGVKTINQMADSNCFKNRISFSKKWRMSLMP